MFTKLANFNPRTSPPLPSSDMFTNGHQDNNSLRSPSRATQINNLDWDTEASIHTGDGAEESGERESQAELRSPTKFYHIILNN